MDDKWAYFLGLCNPPGNAPDCYNYVLNSANMGVGSRCEANITHRTLGVFLDPEFCDLTQKMPRQNCWGNDDRCAEPEICIRPTLQVKRFQRPKTSDEFPCEDLELPFPLDEYEFLCNEIPDPMWGSTFCIQRILLLLHVTPEVADIETRIRDLWSFFERKSPCGVSVKDIRLLLGLVFSLSCRKDQDSSNPVFMESLLEAAKTQLKRGLRVQKLSDKWDLSCFTDALNDLGEIIKRNDPDLIDGCVEILQAWFDEYTQGACTSYKSLRTCCKPCKVDGCVDQKFDHFNFANCVEQSRLGKRVLRRVADPNLKSEVNRTFVIQLTALAARLIELSQKNRLRALKLPIVETILLRLKDHDHGNHLMYHTIEIIYALLAHPIEDGLVKQLKPLNPEAFRVLLFRFLQRMKYIMSKMEINLRNDVGFAVYLLVKHYPNLRTSFGRHASVFAGILANNVLKQKDLPFIIDSTTEDLELLKFIIMILQLILESDSKAEGIAKKYQLVTVLIRIMIGPCHLLESIAEGDPCLEPLANICYLTLNTLAKRYPILFQQPEAIDHLLSVLDIYSQFGNLDLSIVAIFLDILRILLTSDTEGMTEYFVERRAMEIFTAVLKEFNKHDWSMSHEPIMCNTLMSCSILAKYDEAQRTIFADGQGVKILIRLMNLLVYSPSEERHMNPALHICVAEIIWQCLAESPTSLEMFLAYEGIFRLLDLLEIAAGPAAQLHILGCLVELCEYSRCVDQLLYWRRRQGNSTKRVVQGCEFQLPESEDVSNQNVMIGDGVGDVVLGRDGTLSALLCELWRCEENRFKVLREANGIIAALDQPLMSEFSRNFQQENANQPEFNGPPSLDLTSSIRPKIFLLVKKIIEASNTEAIVFGGLSLPNQITMQIIINFLDLKRGEIWLEMAQDLKAEDVQLVDSDEIALERLLKISRNKVRAVIETQEYLVSRDKEHDELNERTLYNTIQMCHLQEHLEALNQAEYFARTSNYFLLIDKRLWQKAQLQLESRKVNLRDTNTHLHRTTDNCLNITTWPGRTKMIESEPHFDEEDIQFARIAMAAANLNPNPTSKSTATDESDELINEDDSRMPMVPNPTSFAPNTEFGSAEEEFSQVAPQALQKALLQLIAEDRKWKWRDAVGETAWKMRSKWRANWYSESNLVPGFK